MQITDEILQGLNFENYVELRKEHDERHTIKAIDKDDDNIYRIALSYWFKSSGKI
jgi:hypothetical protein